MATFWTAADDEDDAFLRNYIVNKGWLQRTDSALSNSSEDEEDENIDELGDVFEHAYNFRFEEPYAETGAVLRSLPRGGTELVTHVREQVESVRRPDERRKEKRRRRAERKKQEAKQKEDARRHVVNERKAAIMAQLRTLHQLAGAGAFCVCVRH